MSKFRPYLLALLLLAVAPLSGSCWDREEIANLAIVMGVGIDLVAPEDVVNGEDVMVTVEIAYITTEGTSGSAAMLSATGRTVQEGIRNLQQSINLHLHWSHLRTLLIGEAAAREGIHNYIKLFFHDHDMRSTIYLVVCEGAAKDVLYGHLGLSPYVSVGIRDLLINQTGSTNGYIHPVSIQSYMEAFAVPEAGLLVPVVAFIEEKRPIDGLSSDPGGGEIVGTDEESEGGEESTGNTANSDAAGSNSNKELLYLKGMGILNRFTEYVGQLEYRENSGAQLWQNHIQDFAVVVREENMQQWVTVEITSWQSQREWQFDWQSNTIKLRVDCDAQGYFGEVQEITSYKDPDSVRHLEELVSNELEVQMLAAWQQVLDYQIDFLNLGSEIWRHDLKEWDRIVYDWPNILHQVELELTIRTQLNLGGESH